MKLILGFATFLIPVLLSADIAFAGCSLLKSTYKDIGGKGFQLDFSGQTATLSRQRQKLFEFNLTQSQGYGTVYLMEKSNPESSYGVYFFGSDLKQSSSGRGFDNAPTYAFVSGLGSAVYYRDRSILLGDTLWKFDRCK